MIEDPTTSEHIWNEGYFTLKRTSFNVHKNDLVDININFSEKETITIKSLTIGDLELLLNDIRDFLLDDYNTRHLEEEE